MNTIVWNSTAYYALGSAFCILAQLILILILLAQRRREKREIQALRASERMHRLLTENAEDLISRHAADSRLLYISPVCREMLGYTPDEILHQGINPFIHPDDLEHSWNVVYEAIAAGNEHYTLRQRLRHKEGHWIWVEVRGRLLYDDNGELSEIYCLTRDITHRKQAEDRLRANEKKFRALFKLLPANASIASLEDLRFLDVNENFSKIHGLRHDEVIGKTPSELNLWADPTGRELLLEPLRQHGSVRDQLINIRTKSGEILTTIFSCDIVEIDGQQYLFSIAQDISKLKQAEEELREREEKYRILFENMAQGVIYRMADGRIDEVNPAALEILEVSHDGFAEYAALDGHGWKIIHEDGSDLSLDEWPARLALTSGKAVRNVTIGVYTPKKEAYTWLTVTAIPQFKQGETRPYRVFTTFHDITALKQVEQELRTHQGQLEELVEKRTSKLQREIKARKRSERSLRESEEKYRLIAENATDVIWTQNSAREFTYFSPSVNQVIGYTPEELLQGRHGELFTPESQEIVAKAIARKRDNDPASTRLELEQIRKDGSTVWVEVIIKRLYDDMGQHTGFLGISRDISDRKQAEATLRQAKDTALEAKETAEKAQRASEDANRAKSIFLSNMSHELRTPLNAILGFAQLLARDTTLSTEQQESLSIINRSGEHLLQLINDVLDMSKIEAGRVSTNRSSFDLQQMLANVEEMIRLRAEQEGLDFYVEYPPKLPRYIKTDEKKLRQILINILGNAVKFTEKGSVTLRIADLRSGIVDVENFPKSQISNLKFEIIDTGPGIASEEFLTVFKAFRRTSHVKEHEGTGLGLAISRKFARLLGGDIQVNSELGRGSQFSVDIQVEAEEPDGVDSGENMSAVIGLASPESPKRILIVDDHAESRRLVRQLLGGVGFEINEAPNGREALTLLEEWTPDLILMDMRMPVMDGYEATREIRKGEVEGRRGLEDAQVTIIAMTASVFDEEQQHVLAAGCNMLLRKPLNVPELFEAIRSYLGVEYLYAADERLTTIHQSRNTENALTPEALAELPDALLAPLKQAVISGNQTVMMQAVETVRGQNAELADSIGQLVQNFKYHVIWKMLQQIASPTGGDE